ncbi:MAG TPA: glycosyltransferase family 4 protein [Vicinamibacterales bacterium]|nr:glycosyltransferase family 4 protein [Vicinamibacterales bacterium]
MIVHARYPIGEPRIQRQAAAALDGGFEVDVICLREPGEAPREIVDGVRVRRLPVRHERSASAAAMAAEYLRFIVLATFALARLDRRRRYDVVHVSNPPDLLVLAGLLPRFRGARLIFDVHDLTPEMFDWRFAGSFGGGLVHRVLVFQERLACRVSDRVMTVHDGCAAVLKGRSVRSGEAVAIVMNTLDERLLPAATHEVREGWHRPVRLVYHGSLTRLYGVHVLIEALAKLELDEPVELAVIGGGDEQPRLERLVTELSLEDRVRFSKGFRPIDEALEKVAAADVGVVPLVSLPINRFALPSKLLEYVALRIPVVCGRAETIAAHFSEQEIAFFTPGNADELARVLVTVISDPAGSRERAQRAAQRYEAYRWSTNRERFLDVLR